MGIGQLMKKEINEMKSYTYNWFHPFIYFIPLILTKQIFDLNCMKKIYTLLYTLS
jgi:hypothetical protein